MNKDELLILVRKIMTGGYSSEKQANHDIDILCENSLDPYVTDHIFYNELTPKEVVEKIIAYKPKRKRISKDA